MMTNKQRAAIRKATEVRAASMPFAARVNLALSNDNPALQNLQPNPSVRFAIECLIATAYTPEFDQPTTMHDVCEFLLECERTR